MRRTTRLLMLLATACAVSPSTVASQSRATTPEPVRVIGNVHYVGGQFGSYLITTPEGHILHDTGDEPMHDLIVANIEALGFDVRDVRIMISSHAHWDHVAGHAAMQRLTGARVVALGGDAAALRAGEDNSALGARGWDPVTVDRVIEDGDSVTLGGMTLRAVLVAGHTQGATMWTTTVEEGGATYSVAFRGGEIPNAGVELVDNPRHPGVVADTRRTLARLNAMDPPDLFLHNHAGRPFGARTNLPVDARCVTCYDAGMFGEYVAGVTAAFEAMLREAGISAGVSIAAPAGKP